MANNGYWVRILYNPNFGAYDLETSMDDGKTWALYRTAALEHRLGDKKPEHVHSSIIDELNGLVWRGHQFWLYGENNREG